MDLENNLNRLEYVIGISGTNDASTSIPVRTDHSNPRGTLSEDNPSTSSPASQLVLSSTNASNSTNSSLTRTENYGRRNRSPLNSGLWITVELVANVSQILAAVIVLSLSSHEHPRTPLSAWIIGYTTGCVATLPHLYWRYLHRSPQRPEQDPAHSNQETTRNNHHDSSSYADGVGTHNPEQEYSHNPALELGQTNVNASPRTWRNIHGDDLGWQRLEVIRGLEVCGDRRRKLEKDGVEHLRDYGAGASECSYVCGGELCRQSMKDSTWSDLRALCI